MAGFVQKQGLRLVDAGNNSFDSSKLSPADVVVLYFSAHWCPPCQQFTPMLKIFYDDLRAKGCPLQIIFVSSDKSEMEMLRYMHEAHGNWLAVSFNDPKRGALGEMFQIQGIPSLVVVDEAGQSVVADARSDVMRAVQSGGISNVFQEWTSRLPNSLLHETRLPAGARVKVRGLQKAPELNGEEGTVSSYNFAAQRYTVDLSGVEKALRASNLLQLVKVSLRDEAHTKEAEVTDYDEATDELILQSGSETLRAQLGDPDGPVLQDGACVTIHGLQAEAAKQWNGKLGMIVSYDESAKRYEVKVSSQKTLRVLPEKIRLCPL